MTQCSTIRKPQKWVLKPSNVVQHCWKIEIFPICHDTLQRNVAWCCIEAQVPVTYCGLGFHRDLCRVPRYQFIRERSQICEVLRCVQHSPGDVCGRPRISSRLATHTIDYKNITTNSYLPIATADR